MFTIEHRFAASVITLIDDGPQPLSADITISATADQIIVEQHDPSTDTLQRIELSISQLRDLEAALDLPEGSYKFRKEE